MSKPRELNGPIECFCCGGVAATGTVSDGDPVECGCRGLTVAVEEDSEPPYISGDCESCTMSDAEARGRAKGRQEEREAITADTQRHLNWVISQLKDKNLVLEARLIAEIRTSMVDRWAHGGQYRESVYDD